MRLKQHVFFLLCFIVLPVQAVELMKWERIPLKVTLHVNEERIVFIERNVRVSFPPELKGKLRIQSAGGVVYLLAKAPFSYTRLVLQDIENGEMILLDINSKQGKEALEPVKLAYPQEETLAKQQNTVTNKRQRMPPIPIALTRFASQSLYAPLRTLEPLIGVHSLAMPSPEKLTSLLPSEGIEIKPLGAWGLQGYSVVALSLRNQREQEVLLDPKNLQGDFYSATFQHSWLGAKGTPEDTTVVYLVTKGRLENAFLPELTIKED